MEEEVREGVETFGMNMGVPDMVKFINMYLRMKDAGLFDRFFNHEIPFPQEGLGPAVLNWYTGGKWSPAQPVFD